MGRRQTLRVKRRVEDRQEFQPTREDLRTGVILDDAVEWRLGVEADDYSPVALTGWLRRLIHRDLRRYGP